MKSTQYGYIHILCVYINICVTYVLLTQHDLLDGTVGHKCKCVKSRYYKTAYLAQYL